MSIYVAKISLFYSKRLLKKMQKNIWAILLPHPVDVSNKLFGLDPCLRYCRLHKSRVCAYIELITKVNNTVASVQMATSWHQLQQFMRFTLGRNREYESFATHVCCAIQVSYNTDTWKV